MEIRELTCINCPLGCQLKVTMEGKEVVSVEGNTCKRGDTYARKEVTNPTRIVTSTVKVSGGKVPMINVKTQNDVPKDKIFECVRALKGVTIQAPVRIGDVVVANVAGTGVNIVAAGNVDAV
jgi:CxxC motif-containing protein